jgi:hypothetical protein
MSSDGTPVPPDSTPDELGLGDESVIDVVATQTGGRGE